MYAQVYQNFWTDRKISEDFTPEERYFMLYLLSNPHGNITGVFEIGYKQMSVETGYTADTVKNLIARLQDVHKVICYSDETRELLILNWYKYNWNRSDRFLTGVERAASGIKCASFRKYISQILSVIQESDVDIHTLCIPYVYPIPHNVTVNVNVNDSVTDTVPDSGNEEDSTVEKPVKPKKKQKPAEDPKELTPEEEDLEAAIAEWKRFRKLLKIPVTAESEHRARAKLEKTYPGDPVRQAEVIRYCIDRGWRGVFPPKKDEQNTGAKGKRKTDPKSLPEREVKDEDFADIFLDLNQGGETHGSQEET